MWAAIERESGGRIHTQLFPNSQLGGDTAMFTQLRSGALQFFIIPPGNLSSVVPVADISYLGFAFDSADDALRVMDGALGAYVRQEVAGKGIYAFRNMWDGGMFQIGSNSRAIRSPEDLKGFRLRVTASKITIDLFREIGASPTTLNTAEIYTGLQTKIVDGEVSPLISIKTLRWYEVNKFISTTNHNWSGYWLIANGETWKSLPTDLQEIIERNNAKYAAMERKDSKELNASLAAELAKLGLGFNSVDQAPFRQLLGSYYKTWASAFGPTAWNHLQNSVRQRLT